MCSVGSMQRAAPPPGGLLAHVLECSGCDAACCTARAAAATESLPEWIFLVLCPPPFLLFLLCCQL